MTYAETGVHAHYVTVRPSTHSTRFFRLAGPFRTREEAENLVDLARDVAMEQSKGTKWQPDFSFGGYGTARFTYKPGFTPMAGALNATLGLATDPQTGFVLQAVPQA